MSKPSEPQLDRVQRASLAIMILPLRDAALEDRKPPPMVTSPLIPSFTGSAGKPLFPETDGIDNNKPSSSLDNIEGPSETSKESFSFPTPTRKYGEGFSKPYIPHHSEQITTSPVPTQVQPLSSGSWEPTVTNFQPDPTSPASAKNEEHMPKPLFAGVGVGVIMVIVVVAALFICQRRRNKRAKQGMRMGGIPAQEKMKAQAQRPFNQPAFSIPPPIADSVLRRDTTPPAPPEPVILGPITPTVNGAWNTGLDTSDDMSMNDHPAIENPFADPSYNPDDPPPPYRPRSLAALSRDVSLRAPSTLGLRTSLAERPADEVGSPVSPLAEPRDHDDTLSFLPETSPRSVI